MATKITEIITTGSQTSVSFGSVPGSGYRDLILRYTAKSLRNANDEAMLLRFNADSSAIYDYQTLFVNNATLSGGRTSNSTAFGAMQIAASSVTVGTDTWESGEINIADYLNTTHYTSIYAYGSSTDTALRFLTASGRYKSTSAISSLSFVLQNGGGFVDGSIFGLYGVET